MSTGSGLEHFRFYGWGIVPLKLIEQGVDGDPTIIYPKPYSIYLRGTIGLYKGLC